MDRLSRNAPLAVRAGKSRRPGNHPLRPGGAVKPGSGKEPGRIAIATSGDRVRGPRQGPPPVIAPDLRH